MTQRILFVGDDPKVLSALRRVLSGGQSDWSLSFAGGSDEALATMRGDDYDVVVTDVDMPAKDGLTLLAEMRANTKTASLIALTHHERWDGTGYPAGLAGERIPLISRIAAGADMFDALCSTRPYKVALSQAEASEIIRAQRGPQFDPEVCRVFESAFERLCAVGSSFPDPGDMAPNGGARNDENPVCRR
jgi:response regulator RpfG family c-di-GMP phosphodiesterase